MCYISIKEYKLQFPDFYLLTLWNDWFCKICSSLAQSNHKWRALIEIPWGFCNYPSDRTLIAFTIEKAWHLIKTLISFWWITKKRTNVYSLLLDNSLPNEFIKLNKWSRYCFFCTWNFQVLADHEKHLYKKIFSNLRDTAFFSLSNFMLQMCNY